MIAEKAKKKSLYDRILSLTPVFSAVSIKVFTQALSLLLLILTPIVFGVEKASEIFVFLSFANILSVFLRLGSDKGMIYPLSILFEGQKEFKAKSLLIDFLIFNFILHISSFVVVMLLQNFYFVNFSKVYILALCIVSWCISILFGLSVYNQCSNRHSVSIFLQASGAIITVSTVLVVFFLPSFSFEQGFISVAICILLYLSSQLFLRISLNDLNFKERLLRLKNKVSQLVNVDLWVIALLQTFLQWGITAVSSLYLDGEQLTFLHTIIRIYAFSAFFLMIFNTIYIPKMAILFEKNRLQDLRILYRRLMVYSTILGLLIVCVIYFLSPIYTYVTKVDMRLNDIALIFIMVGYVVNAIAGPVGGLLIAIKQEVLYKRALIFSSLLGVVLIFISPFDDDIVRLSFAFAIMLITQNLFALFFATLRGLQENNDEGN